MKDLFKLGRLLYTLTETSWWVLLHLHVPMGFHWGNKQIREYTIWKVPGQSASTVYIEHAQ